MKNITATISKYIKSSSSSLTMSAPLVVYLNQNYPKQCLGYKQASSQAVFNLVSFANKSYGPNIGNNIFFQIFPIGWIDETSNGDNSDFKLMTKYTSMKENALDYPSMVLTPAGTLMTAPVVFDCLPNFSNNGILDKSSNQSAQAYLGPSNNGDPSSSAFLNWSIGHGSFHQIQSPSQSQNSSNFMDVGSNQSGYMKLDCGNFGSRKIFSDQKQKNAPSYSYIHAIDCPVLGKQYNSKKHKPADGKRFSSKRIYYLNSYGADNILQESIKQVQKGTETYRFFEYMSTTSDDTKAKPFLFCINFSKSEDVSASLDFGFNRIQIFPNQLYLTVSSVKWYNDQYGYITATAQQRAGKQRRAACSHLYDNSTKAPYFYRENAALNGTHSRYFIVYPAYCGLSIQPGIHFPNNLQSSKQSPVLRGVGSTVQLYVNNKRRLPTLQQWVQNQKKDYESGNFTGSSGCNIFLQPNSAVWNNTVSGNNRLRLTINNGSANFFYMPLYFVSKCRFRMYFKGIKSGRYQHDGYPATDDGKRPYLTAAQASTSSCLSVTADEYQYSTNSDGDFVNSWHQTPYAEHTYYGSLLYTTDYKVTKANITASTTTKSSVTAPGCASFITTPVMSYRIPPVNQNADMSFWDKYSMDGYYFDFKIDLDNPKQSYQPYIRTPLQVQGVLVMQVTKYNKALLDNKNGEFYITSSTLYETSSSGVAYDIGQLQLTGGTSLNQSSNWTNYIQSISTTWNQQGGSGSITVDKYALLGQQVLPQQCIGGLSIMMSGGNPSIIKTNMNNISPSMTRSSCIFTGYGTSMSISDSFTADTITIQLQGPQRKLSDLKLINPPFWDGDKLKTAYKWLATYCGLDIVYDDQYFDIQTSFNMAADNVKKYIGQNGDVKDRTSQQFPRFPTSSNFKRPSIYIKTGQDCFSVLKMLAQKCNCRFVLQPDGKAYIMTQTTFAVPEMCDHRSTSKSSSNAGGANMGYLQSSFRQDHILSYSVSPLLNNLHNYIISAAFQSANVGSKQGQSTGSIEAGFKTNKKFVKIKTTPEIPWAKTKAFKHQGFLSQAKVQQQFKRDIYAVNSYWLNIQITIPGNQGIWIYDKINLFGIMCYVTQISHNVDLVGKKWTTTLTLSNCYK